MPFLRATSRYIFFCSLAVAPWYYGGTTTTSIQLINWLLGTAFLLWVIESFVNRRRPRLPKVLLVLVVVLLGIGGSMVLNASSIYDPEFAAFAPVHNLLPRAAGSVDYAISVAWMIRGALLLITLLFVADLSQDNGGLLYLWYAVGIIAGSISLIGLLQKATGADMIFWQEAIERRKEIYPFFATYYYHANAGAFLNLVLPLTAGLAVRAFSTASSLARAVWLTIFVINLAAVASNTSRMAQFVGLLLLIAVSIQLGGTIVTRLSRGERKVALAGAAAVLLALFALGQASHLEQPFNRWQNLSESVSQDNRWVAAQVAMSALPHIGFFGAGPGTFRVSFPHYNNISIRHAPGAWRFLHEDYLQTLLEWGWVGSVLWAAVFFGGVFVAVRALSKQRRIRRNAEPGTRGRVRSPQEDLLAPSSQFPASAFRNPQSAIRNRERWSPRRRLVLPLVAIALIGIAIHALVDFPLQIYSIQLYVATYLGICWGSGGWKPAS